MKNKIIAKIVLYSLVGSFLLRRFKTDFKIKFMVWGNKTYAVIEDHGLVLIPKEKLNLFKTNDKSRAV